MPNFKLEVCSSEPPIMHPVLESGLLLEQQTLAADRESPAIRAAAGIQFVAHLTLLNITATWFGDKLAVAHLSGATSFI